MRSFHNITRAVACLILSVGVTVGCGGGGGGGGGSAVPTSTSKSIGAGGGTVNLATGPAAGSSVSIPAGALVADVNITVGSDDDLEIGGYSLVGPAVEFGPAGANFNLPAEVTVPYDPAELPNGVVPSDLLVVRSEGVGGPYTILTPISVNTVSELLTVQTSGFSTFQSVGPPTIDPSLSLLSATPVSGILSDGSSAATITVTAKDGSGAVIPGVSVTLLASGSGNSLAQPANPTDSSGEAVGTLSTTFAEVKSITAILADSNGSQTELSSAVLVQFDPQSGTVPTAPSGLNAVLEEEGRVSLSWTDNSSDEDYFCIERTTDGLRWSVQRVASDLTEFGDILFRVDDAYTWRIRAVNDAGSSAYAVSNVVSPYPAQPSASVIAPGRVRYGQSYNSRWGATPMPGTIGARSVAAGTQYGLIVEANGSVLSYGRNHKGQLGDGGSSPVSAASPFEISGITTAEDVAAGWAFSLVRLADKTVRSWGDNSKGQLGQGDLVDLSTPTAISSLGNVTEIYSGAEFAVAVRGDGALLAWGENDLGQCGDGNSPSNRTTPAVVSGIGVPDQVAVGDDVVYVLNNSGDVYAWGVVRAGAGAGTHDTPQQVPELQGVTQIAAAGKFGIAITSNGDVVTWGEEDSGQLGDGGAPDESSSSLVTVSSLVGINDVYATNLGPFAITSSGDVFAWGNSLHGGLGLGHLTSGMVSPSVVQLSRNLEGAEARSDNALLLITPTEESPPAGLSAVAESWRSVRVSWTPLSPTVGRVFVERSTDGILFEYAGEARADRTSVLIPERTSGATAYYRAAVVTGGVISGYSSIVSVTVPNRSTAGSLSGWGENDEGTLGNGAIDSSAAPLVLPGVQNAVEVAVGEGFLLVRHSDKTLSAIGSNLTKGLGDGTTTDSFSVASISGLNNVEQVAAGDTFGLARHSDGTVSAWGDGMSGITGASTPSTLAGLSNIGLIRAGNDHALAIDSSDDVWSWGEGSAGQLGRGSGAGAAPAKITSIGGVTDCAAGEYHSVFVVSPNAVHTSGLNNFGQLGTGSTPASSGDPILVGNFGTRCASGPNHASTYDPGGGGANWGLNTSGQTLPGGSSIIRTPQTGIYFHFSSSSTSFTLENGEVDGYGDNSLGQLGKGTYGGTSGTSQGLTTAIQADARSGAVAAVTSAGEVWVWGANSGQMGVRPANDESDPGQQTGLSGVLEVVGSDSSVLALLEDGRVYMWGPVATGLTFTETARPNSVPRELDAFGMDVVDIAHGSGGHFLAVTDDGRVWSWGAYTSGQLGRPFGPTVNTPQPIDGLEHVVRVYASDEASFAVDRFGQVWTFGRRLENGLTDSSQDQDVPVVLPLIRNLIDGDSSAFSLGLGGDGTLYTWGPGSLQGVYSSTVLYGSTYVDCAAGELAGFAVLDDGTYQWWGDLAPIASTSDEPVTISGTGDYVGIAAGLRHRVLLRSNGEVSTVGANMSGQLGNGSFTTPGSGDAVETGVESVFGAGDSTFVVK